MITPSTKELAEELFKQTIDKNGEYIERLFPDEKFLEIPHFKDFYVSQYARMISVRNNRPPLLLSPYYDRNTGYSTQRLDGYCKTLQSLVAAAWIPEPDYAPISAKKKSQTRKWQQLEVHHLYKVKLNRDAQPIDLNWAKNLRWVYLKYHRRVDQIQRWQYQDKKGRWRDVKYADQLASKIGVKERDVLEAVLKKHNYMDFRRWKYYKIGKIEFRIKEYVKA